MGPAENVILGSDGNIYACAYALYSEGDNKFTTKLLVCKISIDGKLKSKFALSEARSKSSILDVGQNKLLAAWETDSKVRARRVKVKAKLKFFKKEMNPYEDIAPAGKIERVKLIRTDSGKIMLISLASQTYYISEILDTGAADGKSFTYPSPNSLEFAVAPIKGSDKILLLSLKANGSGVPGYVLEGKVLDPLQH